MTSKHTLLLVFTLMTPLLPAAEIHDTIESGEVNAKATTGVTPLLNAVNFNDAECVRVLLKYGADPDIAAADGMTPRALAVQQWQWEITKLLETAR